MLVSSADGLKVVVLLDCSKAKTWEIYSSFKGSREKAYRLYELNFLALVHKKLKFWPSKCPNYENIEF